VNAFERLKELVLGETGADVAPAAVPSLLTVNSNTATPAQQTTSHSGGEIQPAADEAAAGEAVQRAQATLTDLTTRRDSTIKTIEALVAERSAVGRRLATGQSTDSDFAAVESQLDAALARRDGLDELLVEAETHRREAQLALNAVEAPRLADERRQRVADAVAQATQARERFIAAYAEASRSLSAFADQLDRCATIDPNAAATIGQSVRTYQDDPMRRLEQAGWRPRVGSSYTALEYRLIGFVAPAQGV
jgi:hypothetical protein